MRRTALVVLALAAALPGAAGAEGPLPEPASLAFVETDAPRREVHVGEVVRVVLRVGFDAEGFARHAAPLFRRSADAPLHVVAPWLDALTGGAKALAAPDVGSFRVAVNDGVTGAVRAEDRRVGGRDFVVLEIARSYVADAPGVLALPAPRVRFALAERFEEDFVGGRVAVDPREVSVEGTPVEVRVVPLPDAGRPPEFQGAVGAFEVRATVDRARARVGETVRLTVVVEGEGNLATIGTPRLDLLGFHVYGAIDDRAAPRRTVVYDVAPLSTEVKAVPAVPFAFFDPTPPGGYRVARAAPIPFVAEAASGAAPPPRSPPTPGGDRDAATTYALLGLGAALVAAAAVLVLRRRRRRPPPPPDTRVSRLAEASAALRAALARPDADLAGPFTEVVAARIGSPASAVVGRDPTGLLVDAGVPADVAARASSTLRRLTEARYGGASVPPSDVTEVAGALEGVSMPPSSPR